MDQPVLYEPRDRIGYLTLNRPDALNAIDETVLESFPKILETAVSDQSIKALVISGAADVFCVGLDIDLLSRAFEDLNYFRDVLERFKNLLIQVEAAPLPVIAAVNGLARAGGFELILACDLVVAADEARIGDTHLAFGIVPGGGATQRAPRKLGHQLARELIFTGRWMKGSEAAEVGLALKSVPRSDLNSAVEGIAEPLRPLSRPCLAQTKSAMNAGADLPLAQALDLEVEHFIRFLEEEPTSREGYLAYVERREPSWP
jgi:enoyl-CoA hydratase/carnithine racemase